MSGRNRRGRDVMGVGLAALNRLAGATVLDRLKVRKPAERAVYEASRAGFKAVGATNRTFAKVQQRVTGAIRLKLFKGDVRVVGRQSPNALYDQPSEHDAVVRTLNR